VATSVPAAYGTTLEVEAPPAAAESGKAHGCVCVGSADAVRGAGAAYASCRDRDAGEGASTGFPNSSRGRRRAASGCPAAAVLLPGGGDATRQCAGDSAAARTCSSSSPMRSPLVSPADTV
jgi:hypothetical protein